MATPTVYVLCDLNCKFEGMTKEQILSAIMQAVNEGTISNIDAGFITKIKEQNAGKNFSIWTGTQAQYNAIPAEELDETCLYIITDDNEVEYIKEKLGEILESGVGYAEKAGSALYADEANEAKTAEKAGADANGNEIYGRKKIWTGDYNLETSAQYVSPKLTASQLMNKFVVFEFEMTYAGCTYIKRTTPIKCTQISASVVSVNYLEISEAFSFSLLKEGYTSIGSTSVSPRIFIPITASYGVIMAKNNDGVTVRLKAIYETF